MFVDGSDQFELDPDTGYITLSQTVDPLTWNGTLLTVFSHYFFINAYICYLNSSTTIQVFSALHSKVSTVTS